MEITTTICMHQLYTNHAHSHPQPYEGGGGGVHRNPNICVCRWRFLHGATPAALIAVALAHAFALFVAVSVAFNISGGHLNPAVTFGAFVGGNITLLRAIHYCLAQLLGAVLACVLLKFTTGGLVSFSFFRLSCIFA